MTGTGPGAGSQRGPGAGRRPPAYTAAEVAHLTGGSIIWGSPEALLAGASHDSRRVAPGEAFVAIPGERTDGHLFLGAAAARGAAGFLVSRWGPDVAAQLEAQGAGGRPARAALLVANTVAALGQWAAAHRARFNLPVVGITGSVGKTTAKDMTAHILQRKLDVLATEGNLNSDVGLPVVLLRLDGYHQVAVLEMATRGHGQLRYLAEIARPVVGVITEVAPVHLETLSTVQDVAQAKAELVRALPAGGRAVTNADSRELSLELARGTMPAGRTSFGFGSRADVRALGVKTVFRREGKRVSASLSFQVKVESEDVRRLVGMGAMGAGETRGSGVAGCAPGSLGATIPYPGRHNALNVLAAALAASAVGVPLADGLAALRDFAPKSAMRLDIGVVGGMLLIDDAYNANPMSMSAALEILGEAALAFGGRKLAVLGDMLELGPVEEQAHRELGRQVAGAGVDALVGVGPAAELVVAEAVAAGLPRERAMHTLTHGAAAEAVAGWARPGDTVLVKGSRGMALEQVIQTLVKRWQG